MQVQDHAEIVHMLAELRLEHRDLDAAIEQLAHAIGRDELQLTRLKKRKLLLKDHISRLESKLIPDLDAGADATDDPSRPDPAAGPACTAGTPATRSRNGARAGGGRR